MKWINNHLQKINIVVFLLSLIGVALPFYAVLVMGITIEALPLFDWKDVSFLAFLTPVLLLTGLIFSLLKKPVAGREKHAAMMAAIVMIVNIAWTFLFPVILKSEFYSMIQKEMGMVYDFSSLFSVALAWGAIVMAALQAVGGALNMAVCFTRVQTAAEAMDPGSAQPDALGF